MRDNYKKLFSDSPNLHCEILNRIVLGNTVIDHEKVSGVRDLEPFDRGWYAGPVGYIGTDGSEFAVAIRSGLVQNDQLSLYAGAGIVEGSNADDEWDEIENKISGFISVFNK